MLMLAVVSIQCDNSITMKTLQLQKIVESINYLLRKSEDLSLNKLHLMKMIWATDRYHLRKFGRLVTGDSYVAMPKGPVASLSLDVINSNDFLPEDALRFSQNYISTDDTNHTVKSLANSQLESLSPSDIEALDFAWDNFGSTPKFDLVDFTHLYPEWKRHEASLANIRTSISIDLRDFFKNPEMQDDPFLLSADLLESSLESFVDSNNFKQILQ